MSTNRYSSPVAEGSATSTPLPSNRSFGALFAVVFTLVGAWSLWDAGRTYPAWFALAALTALIAQRWPHRLSAFNRAWMKLGHVLGLIVSPIVLGVLYFAVITPFGCVKRLSGWDPMRRRFDKQSASYWIERHPPGPDPDSLPRQF